MFPMDEAAIRKVADACECSDGRARTLLTVGNARLNAIYTWICQILANKESQIQAGNIDEAIKLFFLSRRSMPNPPEGGSMSRKAPYLPQLPPPPPSSPPANAFPAQRPAVYSPTSSSQVDVPGPSPREGPGSLLTIDAEEQKTHQRLEVPDDASLIGVSDVEGFDISERVENTSSETTTPEEMPLLARQWDFVLPVINPPENFIAGGPEGTSPFCLETLVGAMQHGATYHQIRTYLEHHDESMTKYMIRTGKVEGFPIMFYAVGTNDEWMIREFARFDGDVNSVFGEDKIPLLAFAIANSDNVQAETTTAVTTLLSLGATVHVIPRAFYSPFCVDLPDDGPHEDMMPDLKDDNKIWCSSEGVRYKLAKTLNLTQRYFMEKSTKIKKPSTRARQVAKLRFSEPLLGIPYFLIGQTAAASSVIDHLLSYMAQGVRGKGKRPLVMVFAGPSGHGKTELARQLGHLLSLELEVVDCTTFNREDELFGPRAPYRGSEQGSPLNNFLARKNGQPGIVFLDEFEKTGPSIHNALLIPFDKGEYEDRRHRTRVDCSRIIWVLATNAIDEQIKEFCEEHKVILTNDCDHVERPALVKKLSKVIKKEFKEQFRPPITGRISAFVPFLPFSPGEQAVGAHKFLLEFAHEIRQPISLQPGHESLVGNMILHIRRDASVCKVIAEEGYDGDLGIRSLIAAVRDSAQAPVFQAFLEVDKDIEEGEQTTECVLDVRGSEIAATLIAPKETSENQ